MKEAIVHPGGKVVIEDHPIPQPGHNELLVRVIIAGTNQKDWKFPFLEDTPHNAGDDVAGVVEAIGDGVWEFRPGDRVAGLHAFPEPGGAYAEYAILPAHQTFRLPDIVSFEEGATVPLTALGAAFALYHNLQLPTSWQRPPDKPTPLLVYGASTAVGAYAIKLAIASSIHPIVAIGSEHSCFVRKHLRSEEGDAFLDYTAFENPSDLVEAIQQAFRDAGVADGRPGHAIDAVSIPGTFDHVVAQSMAGAPIDGQRPRMAVMMPGHNYSTADTSVEVVEVYTGLAHQGGDVGKRFAYTVCRLFAMGLAEGWLAPHPFEVREEGLEALEGVLQDSMSGKIHAKKILLRVGKVEQ
ncbi:alcohol dehydrogenase GroES-like domain-containing protein [Emericellopsis atlantica]|uniref:Alcohol dehydrogenase GroES-like domain-containing protein n=1 Tax=Emericellopsis atlantica TaxID=2614577 RepID=A0A9P7ZV34_9HYPO|nr:alcohol dehydrogenase GroES-like domain-containing protein [Emericellopsis atlantica]KAG9258878.1 alcohol dehydrogenase GroES-like domain-containing protein [Emericellopsis atlantica]